MGLNDSATVTLTNTSKQGTTIQDVPVLAATSTENQYVTLNIVNGDISNVSFELKQWSASKKFKTISIEYSSNGSDWLKTEVGFINESSATPIESVYTLSCDNLPEGIKNVRLVVLGGTTSRHQVGISKITYSK